MSRLLVIRSDLGADVRAHKQALMRLLQVGNVELMRQRTAEMQSVTEAARAVRVAQPA